jgi:hypothetical protein
MAGPVYHFDPELDSDIKLPKYFDDTFIMYEWSRHRFWEVKLDDDGQPLKINRIFADLSFNRPMDVELGPDGALYVLEWGSGFGGNNPDAKLVRVEFVGNLPSLPGDYNRNNEVDAADYVPWRNTLGQNVTTPFSGADGDGDGRIDQDDYDVWRANFGRTLSQSAAASLASVAVDQSHESGDEGSDGGTSRDTSQVPGEDAGAGSSIARRIEPISFMRTSPARRPPLREADPLVSPTRDDALLAWLSSAAENDVDRDMPALWVTVINEESKPFTRATLDAAFASVTL